MISGGTLTKRVENLQTFTTPLLVLSKNVDCIERCFNLLLSQLNSLKLLLVIFHFNKEVVIVSELPKTKS